MKIEKIKSPISIACVLFVSAGSAVYGGVMGAASPVPLGAVYVGGFGGGGTISSSDLSQQGTAFFPEASGGPLAVNAKGESNSRSSWVVGGHFGYRWPEQLSHHMGLNWTFAPATELEGYYLDGSTLRGHDVNNGTTRLVEHDFYVTYPMHAGVFLVNAILNASHAGFDKIHPYVGVGVGTALVSLSGATSTQLIPSEPGINHYNSGSSDSSTAFAAQPKVGASFHLSRNADLFVEYRFLYLSATDYTFGSTVYPTHVPTSNWDVKIGAQYYNMGTMGVRYDL